MAVTPPSVTSIFMVYRRATGILVCDGAAHGVLDIGAMSMLVGQRVAARVESIPSEPDQRSDLRREAPVSPVYIRSSQGGAATMFADHSTMLPPGQARIQAGKHDLLSCLHPVLGAYSSDLVF